MRFLWTSATALLLMPWIVSGASSTVALSSTPTATLGSPVSLMAVVTPSIATGRVTFYDGVNVVGSRAVTGGAASLTTSLLTAGAHSLRAYYSGDSSFGASTSDVLRLTVGAAPVSANGFKPPVPYNIPGSSTLMSIAVADFNGDSIADIAVAVFGSRGIGVLLGNGDGTFRLGGNYPAGTNPSFVVVGDFNNDGKADLVVTNQNDATVSVLLGNGDGSFRTPLNYPVGRSPSSIAVGDFDGDGNSDIAVANRLDNSISVLPGNGDGTFRSAKTYATGVQPSSIVAADFNNDGITDLATTNFSDNTVSVLSGNGDGTFGNVARYTAGANPGSIAAGDFNGDGNADLVVADSNDNVVLVLLGNGDGTFRAGVSYPAGIRPSYIAVADFNADGVADLVVASQTAITSVLLGSADGSFERGAIVNNGASLVAVGDFNGDGRVDLATPAFSSVNVFLGAVLAPASLTLTSSANPSLFGQLVTIGATVSPPDATGTVIFYYDGQVILGAQFLAVGKGTASQPFTSPLTGVHTITAYYTGDANYAPTGPATLTQTVSAVQTSTVLSSSSNPSSPGQNIILTATVSAQSSAQSLTGTVTFYNGTMQIASKALINGQAALTTSFPAGTFSLTASYSGALNYTASDSAMLVENVVAQRASSAVTLTSSANPLVFGQQIKLAAAVTPASATGTVTFYDGASMLGVAALVNGQASMATSVLPAGSHFVRAGYNGDVALSPSSSPPVAQTVNAQPANGFQNPVYYRLANQPQTTVMGDLNGDGHADLIVVNTFAQSLSVMLGNGDGTFVAPVNYGVQRQPGAVLIGDFNSDGKQDVLTINQGSGVSLFLGNGDGTLQPPNSFGVVGPAVGVAADFDGDGKLDVAVLNQGNGVISVLLGNGDGTFQPPVNYPVPVNPISIAAADFNGDGKVDLVTANGLIPTGNTLSVLLGNGDGTFQPYVNSPSMALNAIVVGDFNGDGKPDVAGISNNALTTVVFLGKGDGTFQAGVSYPAGNRPIAITSGDFNGDGKIDIAVANSSGIVNVFSGNGDGTFQPHTDYRAGTQLSGIVVGELNGDGRSDIVTAGQFANALSVLLGRSAAASQVSLTSSANPSMYGASVTLTASISPAAARGSVTFYDGVNLLGSAPVANGHASLATTALTSGTHSLRAYYRGDATTQDSSSPTVTQSVGHASIPANGFAQAVSYSAGLQPIGVVVADFNGDGAPDYAVVNIGSVVGDGSVSIALGNGDGTFRAPVNYAIPDQPIAITRPGTSTAMARSTCWL